MTHHALSNNTVSHAAIMSIRRRNRTTIPLPPCEVDRSAFVDSIFIWVRCVQRKSTTEGRSVSRNEFQVVAGLSSVQNFVISSRERPLVSGISHATKIMVNNAPPLKHQNVPSDPRCFCITGNSWLPRKPTTPRAVMANHLPRPQTLG